MKKILASMLCATLVFGLVGCNNLTVKDNKQENQTQNEITEETTKNEKEEISLENVYWINDDMGMGYFFANGTAKIVVWGIETEEKYTFDEKTITMNDETANYTIQDNKLMIESGGVALIFEKATKDEFNTLQTGLDTGSKDEEYSTNSEYVGMTINEFIESGANITGHSIINSIGEFYGYNKDKSESYKFTIEDGFEEALDSRDDFDEYEDVIGDFEITGIIVTKLDNSEIEIYIGKTIEELEEDGYEVDGFISVGTSLMLYAENEETGLVVQLTLDETANEKYEELEDPFDEDMGEVFAKYVIRTIEYDMTNMY